MKTPFAPLVLMGATAILAATPLLAQSPGAGKNKADASQTSQMSGTDALTSQLNTSPLALPSMAGTLPPRTDPSKMVASFFTELELNRVDLAYDELLRGSKIAEAARDVETLKGNTRDAIANFGDITGYDLVKTKEVGAHLLSQTYVSTGKNYPIRWRFYFYKATDTWRLIDIRIDDRLMDMFDEPPLSAAPAATHAP